MDRPQEKDMPIEVTLTVPDEVYEQAEQTAKIMNRAVSEVLVDTLVEVMPEFYIDPRQPIMQREKDAFIGMHPQLGQKYLGEYVAIHQGKLIDHDKDHIELIERMRAKLPDEIVLITEVLPEPERNSSGCYN
jgi:hypothetical protein